MIGAYQRRLKEKFYRTTIKLAMAYEAECWPISKQLMHKISVVKIRKGSRPKRALMEVIISKDKYEEVQPIQAFGPK